MAFIDDILFWSTDEAYIKELGVKLREQGLLLEQEDDAAGFLGVTMTKTEEGHLELKQTGLIDRIVEALGLDQKMATPKWTPAEANPLTKDEMGRCRKDHSTTTVLWGCYCTFPVIVGLTLHML